MSVPASSSTIPLRAPPELGPPDIPDPEPESATDTRRAAGPLRVVRVDSLSVSGVPTPRRGARDRVWKNTACRAKHTGKNKGRRRLPPHRHPPVAHRHTPNHGVRHVDGDRRTVMQEQVLSVTAGWPDGVPPADAGLILAGPFARWEGRIYFNSWGDH